jgi:hypothetical protein
MKIQITNVTVQVPRDSNRKGAIFLIGRVYSPLSAQSSYPPPQQPQKIIFGILTLRGSLRQARLGLVWDCSLSAQGLLPQPMGERSQVMT